MWMTTKIEQTKGIKMLVELAYLSFFSFQNMSMLLRYSLEKYT